MTSFAIAMTRPTHHKKDRNCGTTFGKLEVEHQKWRDIWWFQTISSCLKVDLWLNMDSLEFFIDSILGFRGEIGARSMRIMSPTFGGNDHDHHLAPRRLKARARLNKAVRKIGLTFNLSKSEAFSKFGHAFHQQWTVIWRFPIVEIPPNHPSRWSLIVRSLLQV